jgi:hypothetical protein
MLLRDCQLENPEKTAVASAGHMHRFKSIFECPKVHVALIFLGSNDHLMGVSEQEALDSFISQNTATGCEAEAPQGRKPILKRKVDSQVKSADADVEGYLAKP